MTSSPASPLNPISNYNGDKDFDAYPSNRPIPLTWFHNQVCNNETRDLSLQAIYQL